MGRLSVCIICLEGIEMGRFLQCKCQRQFLEQFFESQAAFGTFSES
jgi:hypothetical protein